MVGATFVPMYMNQLLNDCNYIVNDSNMKLLFCKDYQKYISCINKIKSNNLNDIYFFEGKENPFKVENLINDKKYNRFKYLQ